MINMIKTLAANAASALIGWKMVLFGLRKYTKTTNNLIDDNIVELVNAAKNNDAEQIQLYAKKVIDETLKEFSDKSS